MKDFRFNRAFSLVEVTLSLGVISFCLLALFGLLPIGLRSNQQAVEQTAANGILSAVVSDLRATPATSPAGQTAATQQFNISLPANPVADGGTTTTLYFSADNQCSTDVGGHNKVDGSAWASPLLTRYMLTIKFLSSTDARTATLANLQVSWPAVATPSIATGSVKTFVALDRN